MVERKTSNLDAISDPVTHGMFHFTGHAVQRIAERLDISIPTCAAWINAAKLAHKSDVETIEGIARRDPHEQRSRLKLQWYVNREYEAAFLIGDEMCSPRVVVTVLRFRDRSKREIKNEAESFQRNRPAGIKRRGRLNELRRHELEDAVA